MHIFYPVLKESILFRNIEENQIGEILSVLHAYKKDFAKNEIIRHPETEVTDIGLIVKGLVYVTKEDINGNRIILNELKVKQTFGEALTFTGVQNSPICIVSAKPSTIIFLKTERIYAACNSDFMLDRQILKNMIKLLAEKNMLLQMKNDILSQKTTKEKLLLYFEYESKTAGSKTFRINFSREELANFLSINSSALSRELGKMRDEGLLVFNKNKFTLR